MIPRKIKKIFSEFETQNPSPKTELIYHSVFELLISVILSAQATDISVNKATQMLYPIANTPEKILALGEEQLIHFIKTIGLFRSKAKNIIKTCDILVQNYQSQVPDNREALESLPGVGRKTANVVLNTAFGHPTVAVDTHIFRVSNRIGFTAGHTPLLVEKQLIQIIPKSYIKNAHHWLILHGRYVCKARKPDCPNCLIHHWCEFKNKTK